MPRYRLAIVSSDSEASVRQALVPAAILIARFDCGASLFGKHYKFNRIAWGYTLPATLRAAEPTHVFQTFDEIEQRFSIA